MDIFFEVLGLLVISMLGVFILKLFNNEMKIWEIYDEYQDITIIVGVVILVIIVILVNVFNWV